MAYLKELFRSVSAAKTVDSPLLNQLGIQPARTVAARALSRALPARSHASVASEVDELRRHGFVELPEFLPAESFAELRAEALKALSSPAIRSVHDHGGSELEQVSIQSLDRSEYPQLRGFVSEPRLSRLFQAAQRRRVRLEHVHASVERLTVRDPSKPDRESELHVDTFFDTFKCWLYLDEVTEESSPFVYVPGSHRLDAMRLRSIYRESVGTNQGSRRISAEELAESGLAEREFHCPANTLVMANTFGFHRRQPGPLGSTRLALHVSVRLNPFLPESLNRWILKARAAGGRGSAPPPAPHARMNGGPRDSTESSG